MISRRHFLGRTLAATGATLAAGCVQSHPNRGVGILDTHTHFYDPTRPAGVPWPAANDAFLYRSILPAEYEALARPLGITGTLVVEASAWEQDNRWVLDLATRSPFLIGLVGHLKPGRPGFADLLARDAVDRRFRGIRIGTWDGPARLEDAGFMRDCQALAERGLTADVLIGPEQLGLIDEFARRVPQLRLVIDHSANVRIDGRTPDPGWRKGIEAVARHPQVYMKFSGYVEGTGKTDGTAPRDADFYRPTFDVMKDAFGLDRLVFGSNWPVSARFASLATVVGIARDYFQAHGAEDRCFRRNAQKAYQLKLA